jgi:hypothetical protein
MPIHCHVICIVVVALAKWDDLLDPLGSRRTVRLLTIRSELVCTFGSDACTS